MLAVIGQAATGFLTDGPGAGYDGLAGILGEWNSTWAKAEGINGYSDLTIGVLVCRPVMASSVLAMQISGFVSDLNMLFPGHAIPGT